ncbi:ABC transporter permease [Novosphingobium bradum]|uniref:ABC transporter permease n=1 Tax=Novosphingobium bradum TaxID=1737444 RepID=A0ABV7IW39_9SPHN
MSAPDSIPFSTGRPATGRLSTLAAALVVARRDFAAVLLSRSFLFFLIGPLFPLVVGALASGVGNSVERTATRPVLAVALSASETAALGAAAHRLDSQLEDTVPALLPLAPTAKATPEQLLHDNAARASAVLSGTLAQPVLTGPAGLIDEWRGPVTLLAAEAQKASPRPWPEVRLAATALPSAPTDRLGRMRTAQAGQTLLFLLTMLLAGMVLSNLVEEKANKIIEVLAAAIPMDALFLGKLFAMLAISFVGIAVWGAVGTTVMVAGGRSLAELTTPAVGWPLFLALGTIYFAMAYLLLGSVFLAIGSMASTVREVQTLSMPVTMLQLLVFFFASYAVASPGSLLEQAAVLVPFSSPFAMLARAAQDPGLGQHLLALAWQAGWVALFIRLGARLFRTRVMKSGPAVTRRRWRKAARAAA